MEIDIEALERTRRRAVERLLAERCEAGHWEGRLASSALSTATAITALALIDRARGQATHRDMILGGAGWLIDHQNEDGGWGDTDRSISNISTTTLGWAALGLIEREVGGSDAESAGDGDTRGSGSAQPGGLAGRAAEAARRAEAWIVERAGSVEPAELAAAISARYGNDRTFSVPIITMAALCGRLGEGFDAWKHVIQLPFELAAFPQAWYRHLKLPVVSYALPALIAIGYVRHRQFPTANPVSRLVRWATERRTLRVLEQIQPSNGGFLEATPLTSFVTMSLAGAGAEGGTEGGAVAERGVKFLEASVREDGSWPIDTNLATWCTTLSVNALAVGGRLNEYLDPDERRRVLDWLVKQQYQQVHPYTLAPPGGWAWTDLPGGVPDADDTSGALVAIGELLPRDDRIRGDYRDRGEAALAWLEGLQNSDGGIPTFCRGWGKLPFDRSCADITAHALRAGGGWRYSARAIRLAREGQWYLQQTQAEDGAWRPLWFGNQHQQQEENATYGTSRVVLGLLEAAQVVDQDATPMVRQGVRYLISQQNDDGGWGGERGTPSSIEETALATEAIVAMLAAIGGNDEGEHAAASRGVRWLIEHTDEGRRFEPGPIGFYFAKLWYYERLYPLVWTVAALERVARLVEDTPEAVTAGPAVTHNP